MSRPTNGLPEIERQELAADGPACTGECAPPEAADEARLALEVLAEYFALLQQWELNSRSDNGLAPDSPTEDP